MTKSGRKTCRGAAKGFTMIELMIGISIFGILLALAVPSFKSVLLNNRRASLLNDFVASMSYARSEALNRRSTVILCKVSSSTSSACSTATTGYETGWIVATGTVDSSCAITIGTVLRRGSAAPETTATLKGNTPVANAVFFNALGTMGTSSCQTIGTFVYCDSRGFNSSKDDARVVVVGRGGRVSNQAANAQTGSSPATSCSP